MCKEPRRCALIEFLNGGNNSLPQCDANRLTTCHVVFTHKHKQECQWPRGTIRADLIRIIFPRAQHEGRDRSVAHANKRNTFFRLSLRSIIPNNAESTQQKSRGAGRKEDFIVGYQPFRVTVERTPLRSCFQTSHIRSKTDSTMSH